MKVLHRHSDKKNEAKEKKSETVLCHIVLAIPQSEPQISRGPIFKFHVQTMYIYLYIRSETQKTTFN